MLRLYLGCSLDWRITDASLECAELFYPWVYSRSFRAGRSRRERIKVGKLGIKPRGFGWRHVDSLVGTHRLHTSSSVCHLGQLLNFTFLMNDYLEVVRLLD